MIDRQKRDTLAQALRDLVSGRIDNLAFDELDYPGDITVSDDAALFGIFYAVWPLYDDFRSHKLETSGAQRLILKRAILFLHADLEFEWTEKGSLVQRIGRRLLGLLAPSHMVPPPKVDPSVWPFFRSSDYQLALSHPRLLNPSAVQGPATH